MPILYKGSGGMPPGNFEILAAVSEIGIFSDLSPFNAPVDTGIQNVLKCCYLHAIHAVIQLLFISIFVLLPAIAINAIVKAIS